MEDENLEDKVAVVVEILACKGLPASKLKQRDPYVKAFFDGRRIHQTSTIRNSLNPVFSRHSKSSFMLMVTDEELSDGKLFFKIKDSSFPFPSTEMGHAHLPALDLLEICDEGDLVEVDIHKPRRPNDLAGTISIACHRARDNELVYYGTKAVRRALMAAKIKANKNRKRHRSSRNSVTQTRDFLFANEGRIGKPPSVKEVVKEAAVNDVPEAVVEHFDLNLVVEIMSCKGILLGDVNSTDPFVKVKLGGQDIHKTRVLYNTLNPVFTKREHNAFLLQINEEELREHDGLTFKIKDWDWFPPNDDLGHVQVSAQKLMDATGQMMEFKIIPPEKRKGFFAGYITISCHRAADNEFAYYGGVIPPAVLTKKWGNPNPKPPRRRRISVKQPRRPRLIFQPFEVEDESTTHEGEEPTTSADDDTVDSHQEDSEDDYDHIFHPILPPLGESSSRSSNLLDDCLPPYALENDKASVSDLLQQSDAAVIVQDEQSYESEESYPYPTEIASMDVYDDEEIDVDNFIAEEEKVEAGFEEEIDVDEIDVDEIDVDDFARENFISAPDAVVPPSPMIMDTSSRSGQQSLYQEETAFLEKLSGAANLRQIDATKEVMPHYAQGVIRHGKIFEVAPNLYLVAGEASMQEDSPFAGSHMIIVRKGDSSDLILINCFRLTTQALKALDQIGHVRHVIRLPNYHGMDDSFYQERYGATVWTSQGKVPMKEEKFMDSTTVEDDYPVVSTVGSTSTYSSESDEKVIQVTCMESVSVLGSVGSIADDDGRRKTQLEELTNETQVEKVDETVDVAQSEETPEELKQVKEGQHAMSSRVTRQVSEVSSKTVRFEDEKEKAPVEALMEKEVPSPVDAVEMPREQQVPTQTNDMKTQLAVQEEECQPLKTEVVDGMEEVEIEVEEKIEVQVEEVQNVYELDLRKQITLRVEVLSCSGLKAKDTAEPFVKMKLGKKEVYKSNKALERGVNPVFEKAHFQLNVHGSKLVTRNGLYVKVKDASKRNADLGTLRIPADVLANFGFESRVFKLKPPKRSKGGDVGSITIRCVPDPMIQRVIKKKILKPIVVKKKVLRPIQNGRPSDHAALTTGELDVAATGAEATTGADQPGELETMPVEGTKDETMDLLVETQKELEGDVKLYVQVVSCRGLLKPNGKVPSPFVEVALDDEVLHETEQVADTSNPIFSAETGSIVVLDLFAEELVKGNGLDVVVKNSVDKSILGSIKLTSLMIGDFGSKSQKLKLEPPKGMESQDAGFVTVRCKVDEIVTGTLETLRGGRVAISDAFADVSVPVGDVADVAVGAVPLGKVASMDASIEEEAKEEVRGSSCAGDEEIDLSGEVKIYVQIVSCRGLLRGDGKSSDPFVKVFLGDGEIHATKPISRCLNPVYNSASASICVLKTTVAELVENDGLEFRVKDSALNGERDDLGFVRIPAASLANFGPKSMKMKLIAPKWRDGEAGTIILRCQPSDITPGAMDAFGKAMLSKTSEETKTALLESKDDAKPALSESKEEAKTALSESKEEAKTALSESKPSSVDATRLADVPAPAPAPAPTVLDNVASFLNFLPKKES